MWTVGGDLLPQEYRGSYRVHIDGEWFLEDLHTFPQVYEQMYFALYSLRLDLNQHEIAELERLYSEFPPGTIHY